MGILKDKFHSVRKTGAEVSVLVGAGHIAIL